MDLIYNKMQTHFLDEKYLLKMSFDINKPEHDENQIRVHQQGLDLNIGVSMKFESCHNDVLFFINTFGTYNREEIQNWLNNIPEAEYATDDTFKFKNTTFSIAEVNDYIKRLENDDSLPVIVTCTDLCYNVMIVPTLDDNYPWILRRIQSRCPAYNYIPIVYYAMYTGSIDFNLVKQIYTQSGVRLVQCEKIQGYP